MWHHPTWPTGYGVLRHGWLFTHKRRCWKAIELLIATSATPQWHMTPRARSRLNYSSVTPQWLLINSSKTLHNEPDKGDLRFSRYFFHGQCRCWGLNSRPFQKAQAKSSLWAYVILLVLRHNEPHRNEPDKNIKDDPRFSHHFFQGTR